MKLFVDDIRDAPEGWILARTITEAFNLLDRYGLPGAFGYSNKHIEEVSLDHDISIGFEIGGKHVNVPSPDTFQIVARYMIEKMAGTNPSLDPDIKVSTHSANPVGRKALVDLFDDIGVVCTETPYPAAYRHTPERPQNAPG
jgi:hypothetical protein